MYKLKKSRVLFILLSLVSSILYAEDLTESQTLAKADGIVGNVPIGGNTISSAGIGVEETQNASQAYLFFSQTLSNDIYYEFRLYGRYNYLSQNPLVDVPVSNINNPLGYGASGFLGYNFHASQVLDILPYVRFNYLNNMNVVYEDSNGNFINSIGYTEMIGTKLSFKVTKMFTPIFDYSIGAQQIQLTGKMQTTDSNISQASLDQFVSIATVGFNFKASPTISLMPYWQYITVANNPDSVAQASYKNGGFNISPLTNTQQALGFKLNTSW